MTTLRFEKPAQHMPHNADTRAEIAEALKQTPGTWALIGARAVAGSARQDAYSVRRGVAGWSMFGPGYEAEARTLFGEHRVYVRYTGGAS